VFPADGVVTRSARECPGARGPPEGHHVILGRLGRFIFRKHSVKPRDHVIGYRSHVVWPHSAAVWSDPMDLLAS